MTMQLNSYDLDGVKRELGLLIPIVKSSHRVEAMARGLGFGTNAALRSRLAAGPIEPAVNDTAFDDYLLAHQFEKPPYATLTEAISRISDRQSREAIATVMAQVPDLSAFGFGVFDEKSKTPAQRRQELDEDRADMLTASSVQQFDRAVTFLKTKGKRATINKQRGSYGLKHNVERHFRELGFEDNYVANGMFIAAAIHLGYKYERNGPNAYFNIAWNRSRPDGAPADIGPGDRKKAWRNIMVAAVNAGLDQKIFGLNVGQKSWKGNGRQYRFQIAGLDAVAHVTDLGRGEELSINVAVNPTIDVHEWIEHSNAGFNAGEAFATGWLELERGKWLQTTHSIRGNFRKRLLPILSNIPIEPNNFADHGQFIM